MRVISAKGILPTPSTKWSFPPCVREVMIKWLENRKHCLTASLSRSRPKQRKKPKDFHYITFGYTIQCLNIFFNLQLPRFNLFLPVLWPAGKICTSVPCLTNIWLTSSKMSHPSTIILSMAKFLRMFSVSLTWSSPKIKTFALEDSNGNV